MFSEDDFENSLVDADVFNEEYGIESSEALRKRRRPAVNRWVAKGEKCLRHKITETNVRQIRAERAAGNTCKQIADKLNLSISAVEKVVTRRRWAHVVD